MTEVHETMIHLDRIVRNPHNPRREVGDVTELAKSIQELGLLQSLLVRPIASGKYMLEAGERRWTAMRLGTNMTEAPCRVLETPEGMQPGQHSLLVGLVENTHRQDLNPIERAIGYGKLRDEYGMTQQQIAQAQGITDATVNHYMALLELDFKSQERVIRGSVTVNDAVKAVRAHRQQRRKKEGKKPATVFWEADWFTASHPLARKAATICDARQHTRRRRLGKKYQYAGACGECWETAIRQDQDVVGALKGEVGGDAAARILTGMAERGNSRT